jgi:DNA-binding response OmpR family regulator
MKLLLAEDDGPMGRALCRHLMQQGHSVDWVMTGNKMLAAVRDAEYDCIILDLGLPELSGRDCLVNIRAGGNLTPVLVATAAGHRGNRIDLLDHGADDYVVKPFDLAELSARIKAIVRRSHSLPAAPEGVQESGPLTLLPIGNVAVWDGKRIALTSMEFRLLATLLRRSGSVVPRQVLEAAMHRDDQTAAGNAVEVHVHHLRRKFAPTLIQTVRGLGYRLTLPDSPGPGSAQSQV